MAQIIKPDDKPLEENGTMAIPAYMVPSFRTCLAVDRGVQNNLLLYTHGGLGDYICAEPALRFALNRFKNNTISLATREPSFYRHLPFKEVFDLKNGEVPDASKYYVFQTLHDTNSLNWEFLAHAFTQCVDYSTLNMFRCQIPTADRCVNLVPNMDNFTEIAPYFDQMNTDRLVVVHPGNTWQSKAFPKEWWDTVLATLLKNGCRPILLGLKNQTIDVNTEGCLDLRDKLSLMGSCAVVQVCKVVLVNDCSILHMAASGKAWIGFISTVKDPDLVTHWRNNGEWGWRMRSFARGGMWEDLDMCPNQQKEINIDKVDPELLLSWLPSPKSFGEWGAYMCTIEER